MQKQHGCGAERSGFKRLLVAVDPHSDAHSRVIGPLSNTPEFGKAFACKPGDPMVPVDVLYSPSMVAVAMDVTAAGLENHTPVRGSYILNATLIDKANAKDFFFKDSPF